MKRLIFAFLLLSSPALAQNLPPLTSFIGREIPILRDGVPVGRFGPIRVDALGNYAGPLRIDRSFGTLRCSRVARSAHCAFTTKDRSRLVEMQWTRRDDQPFWTAGFIDGSLLVFVP